MIEKPSIYQYTKINTENIDKLDIPEAYKEGIIKTSNKILEKDISIERIVLFGSCAREKVKDKESDIDICVIANFQEPERENLEEIICWNVVEELFDYSLGLDDIIEYDIMLMSIDEFDRSLLNPITVTRNIRDEGVALYKKR